MQSISRKIIVGIIALTIAVSVLVFRSDGYSGKTYSSGVIVAFGDSLTYGPEVSTAENYPAQLQNMLNAHMYKGFTVINMGVNGDTTADGLTRLDTVLAQKPDIVLVFLGANDFLRRLEPSTARQNLEQIIQKLQAKDITIVLGGLRAVGPQVSTEYRRQFNDMYVELADTYHLLLVPDMLKDIRLHSELNLIDRIHPNRDGYAVMVEKNIWPVLQTLFRK